MLPGVRCHWALKGRACDEFLLGSVPQRSLRMPLSACGVDSARWQEGGEGTCLAFPASQRLRPTGWRPQGLPDPPLGRKEL